MLFPVTRICFALLLAAAGLHAQPARCAASSAVPATVRLEGLAELVGDITLTCTGGTPTPAGSPIPQYDITVSLNTNVTSRLLATSGPDQWVEALLIVDEPHSPASPNVPLLACGDPSAPESAGICIVNSTGTGLENYNGITNRPNVWQARQASNTSLKWIGVPLDAPPNGGSRVLRITNVRADASSLAPPFILMTVAVSGPSPIALQSPSATVASALPGVSVTVAGAPATFPQKTDHNVTLVDGTNYSNAVADFVVYFREGFANSFHRKNWGTSAVSSSEQNQNIPGVIYSTESGFENIGPASDPPSPPAAVSPVPTPTAAFAGAHGILKAGRADAGTLLAMTLHVSNGTFLFVPRTVPLKSLGGVTTGSARLVSLVTGGGTTPVAYDLAGGAINGCSSLITDPCPGSSGLAQISTFNGVAQVYYEVVASDPQTLEQVAIPLVISYKAYVFNNLPAPNVNSTISASLGPVPAVDTLASPNFIPHFAASTTAALYSISADPRPQFVGTVASSTCNTISGWAGDANRPNTPIMVTLWEGSTQVASTLANLPLFNASIGGDSGMHGFVLQIPAPYSTRARYLSVRYENWPVDVLGSPLLLNCDFVPLVDSVQPASGSGTSQQFSMLVAKFGDYQRITLVDLLINNFLDGRKACYVAIAPTSATSAIIYLVNDAGDAGGPFASMTVPGTGTVQNSQCSISAAGSSISGFDNNLNINLQLSFTASFAGNKVAYIAAQAGALNSGWQAVGTWNVPSSTKLGPSVVSATPSRGGASGVTYSFTFADSNGLSDLAVANVLVNDFLDGRHACYLAYAAGMLYLVNDAGDAAGPYAKMALPGTGTIQNSQCAISGVGSSVVTSGNQLTLNLNISFTGFTGNRVVYLAARSNTVSSDWQAMGTIYIP